jgi:hypothetical protein
MNELGKLLIFAGGALLLVGILLTVAPRVPLIGRLPGDLSFERGGVRVYLPLATSFVLSIVLTILLNLWLRR